MNAHHSPMDKQGVNGSFNVVDKLWKSLLVEAGTPKKHCSWQFIFKSCITGFAALPISISLVAPPIQNIINLTAAVVLVKVLKPCN